MLGALTCTVLAAIVLACFAASSPGASGGTVVSATVPSATNLDLAACASGVADVTDFGVVTPGSTRVTGSDCSIAFGSSNDTAQLRIRQDDRSGVGMWMPTPGTLDASFDGPSGTGNGKFLAPVGASSDFARAVAVQPDGRIVAAGGCSNGSNDDFCLARFDVDGSLDASFDGPSGTGNGKFLAPVGTGNDYAWAVAVQPDGKIVVAGQCVNGPTGDLCLARFDADGSLDASFDGPSGTGNGAFLVPVGPGDDIANVVAAQPDGRLVVAGHCSNGTYNNACLARFEADGSLDASFDGPGGTGNGRFLAPIGTGNDYARAMVLQPDGRIVTAGHCSNGSNDDLCLARFEADGSFDASLRGPGSTGAGSFLVPVGAGSDSAHALALRPDGGLVTAGGCSNGSNDDFCLASFDQGGRFDDYVTGGGSDRDFASGGATSFFGACLRDVGGGASAVWSSTGTCDASDGPTWSAIPTASTKVATTPVTASGVAHLRFALRASSTQPPGRYVAPVTFDVLAPDA